MSSEEFWDLDFGFFMALWDRRRFEFQALEFPICQLAAIYCNAHLPSGENNRTAADFMAFHVEPSSEKAEDGPDLMSLFNQRMALKRLKALAKKEES